MGVVVKGELFRGKYLEVNVLGRISWWRNCLEGVCPAGNYLRLIVQPAKVWGIIILGGGRGFMQGNFVWRGCALGRNHSGVIV